MSEHIVELLKKRQQIREKRRETFQKIKEQDLEHKTSSVKRIIGGANQYSAVPLELTLLRDLYFRMVETYTGKKKYYAEDMTDSHVALWMRVEKARRKAECDAERFIKAQFVWFDKNFGKAPSVLQLTTDAAIERARDFAGPTKGRVLGNMRAAPVDKAEVFREAERTLQKMMAAQGCDREEFYRRFVVTGLYTFPAEFLRADPAYERAINGERD